MMSRPRFARLAALVFIGVAAAAAPAHPVASASQAPAPPPTCDTPADRSFDFWLGSWTVTDNADGKAAGENVILRVSNGCALLENWTAADGGSGRSINYFDPSDGRWHQTWVGAGRSILVLSGSFADGAMDLRGSRRGADDAARIHRIRWFPGADGSVRQWWQVSADDGRTWTTAFDGKYVRKR